MAYQISFKNKLAKDARAIRIESERERERDRDRDLDIDQVAIIKLKIYDTLKFKIKKDSWILYS